MSKKSVSFASKPNRKTQSKLDAETWVSSGQATSEGEEVTTRFTIDIPTDLHAKIKSYCALKKVKMREEIQALLEKHFLST
jgi:hypothetical protein